jgi:solute:Na+ symporter, SSS family
VQAIRGQAANVVKDVTGDQTYNDVNYVFPTFVTTSLPMGLVGLMIAAIFAAAMSSIAAELNSLSTATVIDFYRRHMKTGADDSHYLRVSKVATGFWGAFACIVAAYATQLGSLIEVVNRFGSYFYGSLLGVFVLAIGIKRATAAGAFWGLIGGMAAVAAVANTTSISFLWYNVVGVAGVLAVGMAVSALSRR